MTLNGVAAVLLCVACASVGGCSRELPEAPPLEEEPGAGSVTGHFADINIGSFDLVDGLASTADGRETVIYVTSKQIASSMLTGSHCPSTMARTLTAVRDAGWVEVTLDEKGTSDYFASGKPYGATSRELEVGGRYWSSRLTTSGDRVSGRVTHNERGRFEFDLVLLRPRVKEVSEDDRMRGRQAHPSAPQVSQPALVDAYRAVHAAALKKDWDTMLAAIGFDAAQVSAIRALADIDADLQAFADRFLTPGEAGEVETREGHGLVGAEGTNSKGAKFINYYWFTPCQDRLVLYNITENPQ